MFWDWNAGWDCQGDKCWRFQSWCGAPQLPTVDSSSGPSCSWLFTGHCEVPWQAVPREMCVHRTKAIAVTKQFWSPSLPSQDWDIQHHGKCCIPTVRVKVVLGITESLAYGALAPAASSLPAQRTGGVFQENLKLNYPFRRLFFPFPRRLDTCQWVVHNNDNKGWTVIFVTYWFLFWAVLCRFHHHITGLISVCKKDVSLTVKTTKEEESSQVQNLIFLLPTIFFSFLWGSVSLNVALETYSARGLGQNLAVLFLKRVLSLLLVSTEVMWD